MKRLIISTVVLLSCSIQFKTVSGWRSPTEFSQPPVRKILGKGAFGVVEVVIDNRNGQQCALKHMDPSHPTTSLEIKVASRMEQKGTCPYIVQTLAYDLTPRLVGNRVEIQTVMEMADGGELFDLIATHKRLPEPLVKLFTIQLVLAIQCLHNMGILYLDGKPQNTLLIRKNGQQSGRLKIADFGISEIVNPSYPFTTSDAGTTFYMAPEVHAVRYVAHPEKRGYASDWWTLGIIIYEMLTGRPPFIGPRSNGSDFVNNLISYYHGDLSKLKFPSHISDGPKELIRNLLRRYPETRVGVLNKGYKSDADGVQDDPWLSTIEPDIGTKRVVDYVQDKTFDFSGFVKNQLQPTKDFYLKKETIFEMKEDRKKMEARLAKQAEDIEWKRNDELKGENAEANKLDAQSKHQINKAEQALFNSLKKPQPGGQGVNNANRPKIEVRQPAVRIPPIGTPRFPNAGGGNGGYADTPAIPRYGQPLGGLPRIRELSPEELARKRAQDLEFEEKQMALEREFQKARLRGRLNGGRERRPY